MAAIYFDPDDKPTPKQLFDGAFYVKFKVDDQVKRLQRGMGKSTMEWWAKQCDNVKRASFIPHKDDCIFEDGYETMRTWAQSKNDEKCYVWARGNLDQLVMDDIEDQIGLKPIWPYHRWRDVRTAVDFLYSTTNGYVKVDYPDFDSFLHITKHHPVDDCVFDAMQLMYGEKVL
jgi:hypothetical protein